MEHLPNQVEIQITEEDIKNGRRFCSWGCPLACAIERNLPFDYSVAVLLPNVAIYNRGHCVANYKMNIETVEKIDNYDMGDDFSISSVTLTKKA